MGYALMYGTCCVCKQLFSFNPVRVPSIRVYGTKEPVCKACIDHANVIRKEKGLELLTYSRDAYEYCDEGELIYGD